MNMPDHLIYLTDDEPGIIRKKWGAGFRYFIGNMQPLTEKQTLTRIKSLAIPPMWNQVWISPSEWSHLQCTGKDQKRRKQYIYHPDWVQYRQKTKFDRMYHFGKQLPKIRKNYRKGLDQKTWNYKRVLSLILYLLDHHYFRIGNKAYEIKNNTYGLTTLRRKHMDFDSDELRISYKAKSGKYRNVRITNKKIAKLVREITELRGYEVFRYRSGSTLVSIDSSDVNEYIHQLAGDTFSAKDFRTWGASKKALEHYDKTLKQVTENPKKKFTTTLVKRVAKEMNNTVTVCRTYYIHPKVLSFLEELYPATLAVHLDSIQPECQDVFSKEEHLLMKIIGEE